MEIERIERKQAGLNSKGKKPMDLVEGIDQLVADIRDMETGGKVVSASPDPQSGAALGNRARGDIRLLLQVIAKRFAGEKNLSITNETLDLIMEDFSLIKGINTKEHVHATNKMLIEYSPIFLGRSIADEMKNAKDNAARRKVLESVYPQARILWYYIVLICRCLCRGDHFLSPEDAQLLGLVDEVLGGGLVQSKREWQKSSKEYQ